MDAIVQSAELLQAKEAYERAHPQWGLTKAPFTLLLALFKCDQSFLQIGKRLGVSATYLRNVYCYFQPFCEYTNGRDRYWDGQRRQERLRRAMAEEDSAAHPEARRVLKRARMFGCSARGIAYYEDHRPGWLPYQRRIRINWLPCLLFWSHAVSRSGGTQEYARFFLTRHSLSGNEGVILYVDCPSYQQRYFVFPAVDLIQKVFKGTEERAFVNIPLREKKKHGGVRARFNPYVYEDAWHLLVPPEETETPT